MKIDDPIVFIPLINSVPFKVDVLKIRDNAIIADAIIPNHSIQFIC